MKRRDFFKLAASSGIVVSASACRSVVPDAPLAALGVGSVEQYVARIDEALDYISDEAALSDHLFSAGSNLPAARGEEPYFVERFEELFRSMMRTTVMTGMFGDLPPELQRHPAIQDRIWRFLPEMDETLTELGYLLESLDDSQREHLRKSLREAPEIGNGLADEIDRHARRIGVSLQRRAQFHEMVESIVWKMKEQSPSILINDYQSKAQKAYQRHGATEEFHRAVVSRLGEDAFWAHQESMSQFAASSTDPVLGPAPEPTRREEDRARRREQREWRKKYRKKHAREVLHAGLWIFGISAVATGIGIIFLTNEMMVPGLILGVTLGPLGLIAGLVILIVAGIQFARAA